MTKNNKRQLSSANEELPKVLTITKIVYYLVIIVATLINLITNP
ncbi:MULTISPECIES: hypothetical protein [Clostridium]|nr:hypothetical protein [Clostridium paraputrificum]MDB2087572.1 hypothetical protein [Clostridium paraputrificum]